MPNTDRLIASCPETQNNFRTNKTTSRNKINCGNSYPQVQQNRLQNSKNVMHRSKLKNVYNKKKTDVNWANYKKQQNFCVTLLRRTKKEYFQNLNVNNLSDNKKFWKTIKPYFSHKGMNSNKIVLKEKGELISDEKQLASIMNKFFINITRSLKLKKIRVALPLL